MFALAFDRRHKILLTCFNGIFNSTDIVELDAAVIKFTADHGPVHGILDFSGVAAVSVPPSKRQPAISPTYKRIIVANSAELSQATRTFATEQGAAGISEPVIVSSSLLRIARVQRRSVNCLHGA